MTRLSHIALLALLLFVCAAPASAATLTRGPFLQSCGSTRVLVRWRTNLSTPSRVRWGPSPAELDSIADVPAAVTDHEVTLAGLTPGSRVYYSVGSSTETLIGDSTTFVVLPPVTGTVQPTRVWVLGDSGLPGADQNHVRDAYLNWTGTRHTDLWLMLGDNAYNNGTDAEFQGAVFTPYQSILRNVVLWPTRGNHEVLVAGPANDYYEFFTLPTAGEAGGLASGTEAYYSFDHANIHFVCLDSQGGIISPSSAMIGWVRADLAANTQPWVVAFWHHPPYTKGSHDSDDAADSEGRMRDMRQYVLPVLDSLGVDLVLTGHSHSYERSVLLNGHYGVSSTLAPSMKVDAGDGRADGDGPYVKPTGQPGTFEGAVYAVAGSGSRIAGGPLNHPAMVVSLNVLGSMVIDVNGARLDARFLDAVGAVRDSFAILKNATLAAPAAALPVSVRFRAPVPAPFAGDVRIGFVLPRAGHARLSILGADGRRVAALADRAFNAGEHMLRWEGRDASGRSVPPGVYFAVIEFEGQHRAQRLVRVR